MVENASRLMSEKAFTAVKVESVPSSDSLTLPISSSSLESADSGEDFSSSSLSSPKMQEHKKLGKDAFLSPLSASLQPTTGGNNNRIRVVTRIRPLNTAELQRSCRVALYPDDAVVTYSSSPSHKTSEGGIPSTPKTFESGSASSPEKGLSIYRKVVADVPSFSSPSSNSGNGGSNQRSFELDAVLPSTATQEQVYETAVGSHVLQTNLTSGYNTTILAYGQTGSGKTHTMMRYNDNGTSSQDDGVVPRAIRHLFQLKDSIEEDIHKTVSVSVSCLEIHQDELRDLLAASEDKGTSSLQLRDYGVSSNSSDGGAGGGVLVQGLSNISVSSKAELLKHLHKANRRRVTSGTNLNAKSSRSHTITTIHFETTTAAKGAEPESQHTPKGRSTTTTIRSKLTLVDLAGSERIKISGVEGQQRSESININKDLFVLGKVVSALAEQSSRQVFSPAFRSDSSVSSGSSRSSFGGAGGAGGAGHIHVPYRDSKLTRLLRDSLGGNCFTVLIACVAPTDIHVEESVNTLRYAERSRTITNRLQQNVIIGREFGGTSGSNEDRMAAKRLKEENGRLQRQIQLLQKRLKELDGLTTRSVSRKSEPLFRRYNEVDAYSTMSSCLSYELNLNQSCEDDESDTLLAFSQDSQEELQSSQQVSGLTEEVNRLEKQKIDLNDQVSEWLRKLEKTKSELNQTELSYRERKEEIISEMKRDQELRDDLAAQIEEMKSQVNIFSSEFAEDTRSSSVKSFFRNFRAVESAKLDESKEEIGMNLAKELAKSLGEERTRSEELEYYCKKLKQKSLSQEAETLALRNRNEYLEREISRLRYELEGQQLATAIEKTQNEMMSIKLSVSSVMNDASSYQLPTPTSIILNAPIDSFMSPSSNAAVYVNRNVTSVEDEQNSNEKIARNLQSSLSSPETTMADQVLKPKTNLMARCRQIVPAGCISISAGSTTSYETDVTKADTSRGVKSWTSGHGRLKRFLRRSGAEVACACESSILATNDEHVQFYLPLVGIKCSCGKHNKSNVSGCNPSDLKTILRPWQVEFLYCVGISDAISLVHAHDTSGSVLAEKMRLWRRDKKMRRVRTKNCAIALRIWSHTCKHVMKTLAEEGLKRPEFLDIVFNSDQDSVSTMGAYSAAKVQK